MGNWTKMIPEKEITDKITKTTVDFAEDFGKHLGTDDKDGHKTLRAKLTTSQLRKFFGEVKRQQMIGYNETDFILLKPKLAYAVGRATGSNPKINDFYNVITDAIDKVKTEKHFKNFIKIFEAIVAYHKAAEESKN
ncbi:MAG: type III-A CRISPR-associated protein Csm2 [Bacteroidales bacterium]|jgi:CRISPR-associated protein Csm2|nr:type III-A CRISPR-associated protein Csm2 [Bacteroidales bacterium]MDD4150482.1 type III-A CRISPR-associated protein Csm2 [Bacteroidales bacterium]MDY0217689.1 type III-A CRISPR-associated protein Csm2 [Bacteroidales bacterium]